MVRSEQLPHTWPSTPDAMGTGSVLTHPSPPVSEFVYFLAAEGHIAQLDRDHVRLGSGDCACCGKPWPCNWRRLADDALLLRTDAAR